jgi:UDP-sugar transporter A1/2/3
VPSFLYCLYNNLTFVNLSSYDPTTYFLLLQFRVVVTGILFEVLFSKRLSKVQWLSLILLTIGCIIKQINYSSSNSASSSSLSLKDSTKLNENNTEFKLGEYLNTSLILILVQVFASCFAGVYNEYLLKERDNHVDIMLQNVFMYVDSIICNLILLGFSPSSSSSSNPSGAGLIEAFSHESLSNVFQFKVILIMMNNACIGIVTSLFLRYLNSILKAFASALELMFTGVLSWLIFNIPLDSSTCLSILIVSFATWLYSKNPVHNPAQNEDSASQDKDKSSSSQKLISTSV